MECGIVFGLGVKLTQKERNLYMRFIFCLIVAAFALEANAGDCQNGRCCLNGQCGLRPVPKVVQATGEVVQATVQATKNVTVGTVRAVTPPYGRRCRGGRCYVR